MEKELMALAGRYLMGTYNRYPIVLERGSGTRVWDTEGREYLDFVAGIAVCSLGHAHPHVTDAIRRQAETLVHVSNLYFIETQIRYAAFLMSHAFEGKVFFCNSGAEANEAAIKLARKYGNEVLGQGCNEIVSMKQSFHGRTLATVAATGQEKIQKGFDPLPGGFTYAPFNDLAALEGVLTNKTCAVLLEPIQGEGGVRIPDAGYLSAVRRLCRERGILLIFDEVQVGMGRTGRLFAHEHDGVTPDVMTLAKALGNGMPVGAMVASDRIAATFTPGSHASTFGGNPLAMAAAHATLDVILGEGFLPSVEEKGRYLLDRLRQLMAAHGSIREVRGKGLIVGVEMDGDAGAVVRGCMVKGLLAAMAGPNVLRFVPPLVVTTEEIDQAVAILNDVLEGL
jgi:predicted acetylornithine/succinylornithine family transaminase